VSIVLGLASSAAYDGIKVAIAALAKKNDVTVEDEREEEAEGK
jgi:hypothetical protein